MRFILCMAVWRTPISLVVTWDVILLDGDMWWIDVAPQTWALFISQACFLSSPSSIAESPF
jgi:hypothetical protein